MCEFVSVWVRGVWCVVCACVCVCGLCVWRVRVWRVWRACVRVCGGNALLVAMQKTKTEHKNKSVF